VTSLSIPFICGYCHVVTTLKVEQPERLSSEIMVAQGCCLLCSHSHDTSIIFLDRHLRVMSPLCEAA